MSSHTACPFSDTRPGIPGSPRRPCPHTGRMHELIEQFRDKAEVEDPARRHLL